MNNTYIFTQKPSNVIEEAELFDFYLIAFPLYI